MSQDRDVVIVDDIISTGGTIVSASKILKDLGANKVVVGCVHPVLVEDALLKIFAAGVNDVFATDTLNSDVSTISVAPLISGYLKKYRMNIFLRYFLYLKKIIIIIIRMLQ